MVTKGKTLVTKGKTLVTKEKTLVTKGKTLVTKGKTMVTKGKTLVTDRKKQVWYSGTSCPQCLEKSGQKAAFFVVQYNTINTIFEGKIVIFDAVKKDSPRAANALNS